MGTGDQYLKMIKKKLSVKIAVLGNEISITGDAENVDKAVKLFDHLKNLAMKEALNENAFVDAVKMILEDTSADVSNVITDSIKVGGRIKNVAPKSKTQWEYINQIKSKDMVFGIGPAGTGKTFLAMAMAINYFMNKRVGRIILTRPAVEAGEKLGFLPGDLAEKINPYLRPLYDALYGMMDSVKVNTLIEKGVIEVAPLAFMRGRTLNDSFIILDEAQNTTEEQMKMFLTRMGFNSKAVVTGDITQIDLPREKKSGLVRVVDILKDINDISFVRFGQQDVVRHNLVQKIIRAYENYTD